MTDERAETVHIGRLSLRVSVRPGTVDNVPLLLCNGIGAHHEALRPFVDALHPSITAIRFDAPGVGASSVPWLPMTLPATARTAKKLVSSLGYRSFDVLGISWGGALAQQIALQYPLSCRRVVLVATATGSLMVPASPRVLRHLLTPSRYRDAAYARSVAGKVYGGAVRHDPSIAETALLGSDRPPSRRAYAYQLLATAGWTSLPFLPLIRQTALILAGTDDPIVPLINARILAALLPHATLRTYDDGHLGLLTRAEELAAVVSTFLNEPPSGV